MARSDTEREAMVRTVNLNAEIPTSRELHITLPADFPIGPAEMDLVVSSPAPAGTGTLGDFVKSEFFGMWADRTDIEDSAQFARHVRTEGWKRSA